MSWQDGASTPGPWRVQSYYCSGQQHTVVAADGRDLSRFQQSPKFGGWTLRLADARLIAAAPELIEALDECLQAIAILTPDAPEPLPDSVIGKAQLALAKARGEVQ